MKQTFLPLPLLAAACSTGTESPTTPLDAPAETRQPAANLAASREQLARQFARALRQPDFRGYVQEALDTSTVEEGKIAVDDVCYPSGTDRAGEIIVEAGHKITKNQAETIATSGVSKVEVVL